MPEARSAANEFLSGLIAFVMCNGKLLLYFVLQMKLNGVTMKTEMLSTRIDHDTKLAFTQICDEVGLSPSQAIKLFARAVINHGGIPFELKAKQPNRATEAAMQELQNGLGTKANNVTELFSELSEGKHS